MDHSFSSQGACPICKGENLSYETICDDGSTHAYYEMECDDCGFKGREFYELVYVETIRLAEYDKLQD